MPNFLEADLTESSQLDFGNNSQAAAGFRNTIPTAIYNRKTQVLVGPILVQVILVLDISRSKLSLLDAIKADPDFPQQEQSSSSRSQQHVGTEATRNRRSTRVIIRLPGTQDESTTDDNDGAENLQQTSSKSSEGQSIAFKITAKSMHKVILQDVKGTLIYGIELQKLPFLSMTTPLGSKVCNLFSIFQLILDKLSFLTLQF